VVILVVQHADKQRTPGDPGLSGLGQRQAEAVARHLAGSLAEPPIGLWGSPLRRARETAVPIAHAFGMAVTVDDRLRERMNWAGDEDLADFLDDWHRASADRSFVPRSGDSSAVAGQRFVACLRDIAAEPASTDAATAVVVTHGGVTVDGLRTMFGDAMLTSFAPTAIDEGVPSGAITTIRTDHAMWKLVGFADVAHLAEGNRSADRTA
jgi:broad specificity phosphatase PhoE